MDALNVVMRKRATAKAAWRRFYEKIGLSGGVPNDIYDQDQYDWMMHAAEAATDSLGREPLDEAERVIIPVTRKHLTADDWDEIGGAFADNGDPRFSIDNDEEFRQLFARILNLAPAEIVGGDRN